MIRTPFNTGWTAGPSVGLFESFGKDGAPPRQVHLPHDLLRHETRDPGGSNHVAFHPSATVEYIKTFDADEGLRDRVVVLEFDGVYRDAVVYVNGEYVGQEADGYTRFQLPIHPFLRFDAPNEVKVISRVHEDSRWYSGVGIHREVTLLTGPLLHVAVDGTRVTTPDIEQDRAVVAVATTVDNDSTHTATVRVQVRLLDADGTEVAAGTAPVTLLPGESAPSHQRLLVRDVRLWGVDSPHLYRADITLLDQSGQQLDVDTVTFGVRRLQLDVDQGLRINGETVKLRGACIHHDNGILGAAAIGRAEERRIELLKAAGFNAIRSAHNPLSSTMLDACDRLGMLVMDEAFDVWTESKTAHDYSLRFADWWQRDVDALVRKDFNHPSVIFYSIGNEIVQTGSGLGSRWGRLIAERIRGQDSTRFITNAINPIFSVAETLQASLAAGGAAAPDGDPNEMLAKMQGMIAEVIKSDLVSHLTEESFGILDAGGLNYGETRYAIDADLFPNRVLIGSETLPTRIAENWALVQQYPHVLGDFTWTGWDYLGEVGVGRVIYDGAAPGSRATYPWLTAWVGDIDITGHRRPASYYREIVFGRRTDPYLAVHRPERHGQPSTSGGWSWTDSISSWSWATPAGSPVTVDVYSTAPEVELVINGRSHGRQPAGAGHRFTATFEVTWEPGEVTAIDYDGERETGRTTLRTVGDEVSLTAVADRTTLTADDADLAFIDITLADQAGVVATQLAATVTVEVDGPAVLEGLGNADPATTDRFDGAPVTTFDGRAAAIVRPNGPGEITVTVTADGYAPVVLALTATKQPGPE